MAVRVVTDSTADLPLGLARALGIIVVPLTVRFGEESYLDGVDLTAEEFYRRLPRSPSFPTTSQPTPLAFQEIYGRLAEEGAEVVSIHISGKLSGTLNSALLAREGVKTPVEVVDSQNASMGLGLVVLAAARAAGGGASRGEVVGIANVASQEVRTLAVLDTLEYLHKGGRIGKAQALLGSLLNIKPLIQIKEGEVHPLARVRSRAKAIDRLYEEVASLAPLQELAMVYTNNRGEAEDLARKLESLLPRDNIHMAAMGPVIGTYAGPGALGVAVRRAQP